LRTARIIHVIVALLLVTTYPFLPDPARNVTYPLAALTAVLAVLGGVRMHRPGSRTPWWLLAGAFAMYLLGDLCYNLGSFLTDVALPFPWFTDIAYLAFYPIVFASLGMFLYRRQTQDRSAWLDAQIWALGAAILAWKPLIEPYLVDSSVGTLAHVVAVSYPVLDLGLLLMVVRLMADRAMRRPAGLLLGAGVFAQTMTDFVYGARSIQGVYVFGELTDVGFLVTYAIVGAAALHPSMVHLTEPSPPRSSVNSRGRLLGLLPPALLAPALLQLQLLTGRPTGRDAVFVAIAFTALLLLVGARASGLIAVSERTARELHGHQVELEVALRDRDEFTGKLEEALLDNEHFIWELKRHADHDTLTGLLSRDRFVEELAASLALSVSGSARPSMAYVDLDDFKAINDTLGHETGDLLLVEVARRITAAMGADQPVARFGGDEFAVLVVHDVEKAADQLLEALRAPFVLEGQEIRLEVSIGVTTADNLSCSPGEMLREADIAMYAAKSAGGGRARYRTTMSAAVAQRLTLRARLMQGLADAEVEPWFQPVVDLSSGRLVGFEALARWCRPGHSPLPPDEWLPWAEESGLIVTVDRAVLHAAIAQLATWRRRFDHDRLELAINMSGRSLQSPGIEQEVLDVLHVNKVPADRLVLEVTEGVLIDDDRIGVRLQRLRAAGVRIALDDFGTGWSSLSNLRRLPVDQLKLDRSFTAELGRGRTSEAVPAAIIQLSHALSLGVVAEGVETQEQRKQLIRLGFDHAQGYLFGPAERGRDLDELVSGRRVPAEAALPAARAASSLSVVR